MGVKYIALRSAGHDRGNCKAARRIGLEVADVIFLHTPLNNTKRSNNNQHGKRDYNKDGRPAGGS
ncbi:hypothetical protein [Sinomicrobium sp. M5D2P17]